jgi:hypothetical protein
VAGITLVLMLALRSSADLGAPVVRRVFQVAAELAILFTLLIVAVALQRLSLYVGVYGLSLLRMYAVVFAGWIALVYGALGLSLLGLRRPRTWFPAATVLAGIAVLLALNVANPEAVVARYNLAHAHQTRQFDPQYLAGLSADAMPALAEGLPGMDPLARSVLRDRLCGGSPFSAPGWTGFNWSDRAADDARARAC